MKPVGEVISLETIANLPTTEAIESNIRRIEELEAFEEMRNFHDANVPLTELESLLTGCGQMIFNGVNRDKYVKKLVLTKPSKIVIVTEDFI